MKLSITHLGNNDWFNFKSEIIYGLYHSFRRLGYDVTINHNNFSQTHHNLIIGADWINSSELLKKLLKSKIAYSIYEVEAYDGITINHRNNFNNDVYLDLIKGSAYVISPYKYNIKNYNQLGFSGKTIYAPWGYYEEAVNNNLVRDTNLEFDAVFFGLLKGSRLEKINELKKVNNIAVINNAHPYSYREYFLMKSKFSLSLSSGEIEHFVNPFRLVYLQANGIEVISDSVLDEDGYLNDVRCTSFEKIPELLNNEETNPNLIKERISGKKLTDNLSGVFK